jgi:3-dehydroquinate dehydratase
MKRRKGKWGGYPATELAALMGINVTKAKRYLYALKDHFKDIDVDVVGMMIQEVRNREELKRVKRLLK